MKQLPALTRRETLAGSVYLMIELFLLPDILILVNRLLSAPLSAAQLNFIYFAVNFAAILCIFRRFLLYCVRQAAERPAQMLLCAAVWLGVYWSVSLLLGLLIQHIAPDFSNVNDNGIQAMAQSEWGLTALGTVLLVPTVEETLYRGLLFGSLHARSRLCAYLVSVTVFSAIHVIGFLGKYSISTLLLCFLQYIPAGLCLCRAYEASGSILPPILIHTAVNAAGIFQMLSYIIPGLL